MESEPLNNLSNKENKEENKIELEEKEPFQKDKYKKKGEYPNFLSKLYQILENESYKDIIHWTEDGKYFIISNLHDFTEKVLPKYYKHNNYSSFIRQLNMYDFHKKKSGQNEHVFHHQNFIRNRKDLLKLIKRKSKKENIPINQGNIEYNNQNNLLQLYNNPNRYSTYINKKNNMINSEKRNLSIDDDVNLSGSIHSIFNQNNNINKNIFFPNSSIPSSNMNNINNENYNKQLNDDILNDIKIDNNPINNGQKGKITKNNLQNLLTSLTHTIDNDIEKEKCLESKIEQLSKQNEEFISQNKKILQEIITKKEYNKKLEAVICFIFELLKPKSNTKFKNNQNTKNLIETEDNNHNQSLINFSLPKNDINDIISNKNFIPKGEVLEPFQDFINKYLGSNKNGLLPNKNNNFINQDYNYLYKLDNNPNIDSNSNNVKALRRNLLCSGNEDKEEEKDKISTSLINIKRKRSGSLSSILSDISKESKESKIIYNDNKAKNEGEEEKIEENIVPNVNVISEINNESFDSLNKSKNVFDIDFPQEENKSENNEFSQDLLNNSCTTFNYMYNNSNLNNNSDVFNDVNK